MVYVYGARRRDKILSPSSDSDVVLAVISARRGRAKEARDSVNSFLRFLNLDGLVKGESKRGVDKGVGGCDPKTMEFEVMNLDDVDVIVIELRNWRETRKLARRRGDIEQWYIPVRGTLRGTGSGRRRRGHGLTFIVHVSTSCGNVHLKVGFKENDLNVYVSSKQSFDVETPHEFP